MERVLATVELLELVLLQLDPQTLLTSANRVCRFWNEAIQSSSELQTLLFLRPERVALDRQHEQIGTRMNPLLLQRFEGMINSTLFTTEFTNGDTFLRPDASWRRMLMQQPAFKTLGVWRVETGCGLDQGFKNTTQTFSLDEEGVIRMGPLIEYASSLEGAIAWTVFWGEGGLGHLEESRNSLLFRKAPVSERISILKLWRESDVIIKLSRWSGERR